MKKFLLLAIFALATINLSAANEAKPVTTTKTETKAQVQELVVKGHVVDASTNEMLAGATITIDGQKIYTDLDGNFVIKNFKPGKVSLKISMISYADQTLEIDLSNASELNVKMKQI